MPWVVQQGTWGEKLGQRWEAAAQHQEEPDEMAQASPGKTSLVRLQGTFYQKEAPGGDPGHAGRWPGST